jgi:hypothetical protein
VLSYSDHNQIEWFTNGVKLPLGNCSTVNICSDNWLGSEGVWHWNLSWRCPLLCWADRSELIRLLDEISPNARSGKRVHCKIKFLTAAVECT